MRCLWVLTLLALIPCPRAHAEDLRILTLNTWLLPAVAVKDHHKRRKDLPQVVAGLNADVILLQEVWTPKAKDSIRRKLGRLGYAHSLAIPARKLVSWNLRGLLGSGLLIFSRHPFIRGSGKFLAYDGYTRRDEYFVRKGVLGVQIQHPTLGAIEVFNSHLGAVTYEPKREGFNENEVKTRQDQLRQALRYMGTQRSTRLQIFAGDLNAHPYQWEGSSLGYSNRIPTRDYDWVTREFGYVDATRDLSLTNQFFTFDTQNPYVQSGTFSSSPPEWIDYVFYTQSHSLICEHKVKRVFDQSPVPGSRRGLPAISDHYGVLVTLVPCMPRTQ